MQINLKTLKVGEPLRIKTSLKDELKSFLPTFKIKDVLSFDVDIRLSNLGEEIYDLEISTKGRFILVCAYSLKPFEKEVVSHDHFYLTYEESEDLETLQIDSPHLNIDGGFLLPLIDAEIGLAPKSPDVEIDKIEGLKDEKTYRLEKEEQLDPRLSALDEFVWEEEDDEK